MNLRAFFKPATAFLLVGLLGACASSEIEKTHEFDVDHSSAILTEDLALASAKETLSKEGYDPTEWQPIEAKSPANPAGQLAPNGKPERYLKRLGTTQTVGRVAFRKGTQVRQYDVELKGKKVICTNYFGS